MIAAVALALPTSTSDTVETAFTPRVPSQAPPRPQIADLAPIAVEAGPASEASPGFDRDGLQQDRRRVGARVRHGRRVGVRWPRPTATSTRPPSVCRTTAPRERSDDRLDVMSVTKLFTANLVYRAVDAGLLDLDAPLPQIDAEPEFPYAGEMTVRQLLAHRSGIVNYRDSSRYAADPSSVVGVSDAIASSMADPLASQPGAAPLYSSTNYLLLGRLLEQVTGVDYDALLAQELLQPLGLTSATHLPPDPGEPRFATAGLVADVQDLGRAGLALLRDHVGVSDESYAQMLDIDVDSGMGPGLNGFCPCERQLDGGVHWYGVGYTGGNTLLAYVPDADVVVTIDVTGGLYGATGHFDAVMDLARRLTTLVTLPVDSSGPI